MPDTKKEKRLKAPGKLMSALKGVIQKNKAKRKIKKTVKKAKRRERIFKLKGKVDEFMKAAFEPKSAKTARRKNKKLERKIKKNLNPS